MSDVEWLFWAVFALEFLFIAFKGLQSLLNLILLDREIRRRYIERADFINGFYRLYLSEKNRLEEEAREVEEARVARAAAMAAEAASR